MSIVMIASKALQRFALIAIAGCTFLAQPAVAAEGIKGNLVDVRWLEKNLQSPDVVLLDASFAKAYAQKHIPGALSVDVLRMKTYGVKEEVPFAEEQRTYQALGISAGKKIVMYDEGGTWMAARLLYRLQYHGVTASNLFLLDGGLSKWQSQGLAVTKEITPAPRPGTFRVTKIDESVRVRLPEFLTASGDMSNNVLLEALGPDWHFGEVRFFSKPGHIPNAVLLPAEDFFNADKTFKSPEEIRRMLAFLSVRPEQQIYTHCGGGGAAAVPYFALKFILGYPRVKLYNESQLGWLSDERDLPYWTYDAPNLMRDTEWLGGWGGKMLRMYGISSVSVVDVRAPEDFKQSHLPFALNVPADVFRTRMDNPAKLAEALGSAGVNAADEAVIVSGAGLTRDSALAFLMLEKMGQKKVSVFMESLDNLESLDRMARRGLAVTKDSMPQPATAYPGNPRNGVTLANAKSPEGLYPKVFIASGASVPATAPQGKVVHVPYTSLLNADGTPKAAKDVWNILAKAGVPRYAEIVCFSDDPGEAAVNYFILKLMGFPDAKVLVT
jgi:thiosulfate/3-mercaptopyruvate sulfurtransferase